MASLHAHLWWFHVQHFSDSSLHDKEMRIIDVHLYRTEQVVNFLVVTVTAIDQVFVSSSHSNLKNKVIADESKLTNHE